MIISWTKTTKTDSEGDDYYLAHDVFILDDPSGFIIPTMLEGGYETTDSDSVIEADLIVELTDQGY